jgi:Zn-dependent protease with chaperone function
MDITTSSRPAAGVAVVWLLAIGVYAQTEIKLPKNNYTPQQDVEIGREAANEVRQQFPVIKDERIANYLATVGERLVAAAPEQFKQSVYQYSFTPVNVKEINAFALPGGPMFVHRGMFDAAADEGGVVGIMAHELSHVLLRHGTANATKAQNPWLQLGQVAGQIGGAMVGGTAGSYIAQGSQFGLGTLLLRYGRDFEKQADLLGVQIMARAGYDPRALARMFETIEKESKASGGGGTPQWMSSHPNPGNRTQYINKEAESLTIAAKSDESEFVAVKNAFTALAPAVSMAELAKARQRPTGQAAAAQPTGIPGQPVPAPSSEFKTINGGKVFQVAVPGNWSPLSSNNSIKVVPENGYGELNGQTVFTHGMEFGVARSNTRDLREATAVWLNAVAQNNPDLRLAGKQETGQISQRTAIATPLSNPSPLGGQERIVAYTTFLADGTLFYILTLVPEAEAATYHPIFQKVVSSLRLTEVR